VSEVTESLPETLSADALDEIDARAARASAGPWRTHVANGDHSVRNARDEPVASAARVVRDCPLGLDADDAHFIAHARDDVPRLVAEVRRLRGLLGAHADGPSLGFSWQDVDDELEEEFRQREFAEQALIIRNSDAADEARSLAARHRDRAARIARLLHPRTG
jgi:hypothetical protein